MTVEVVNTTLKPKYELQQRLEAKRNEVHALFAAHPNLDMSQEQVDEIQAKNAEMNDLQGQIERMAQLEGIRDGLKSQAPYQPEPARSSGDMSRVKTIGELFVESNPYKTQNVGHTRNFVAVMPDVDVKTVLSIATGYAPANDRGPRVVLSAQRRPVVSDLIPQSPTTQSSTSFMEETTFTNNAAFVAESGTKPEAALAYTQRNQPIEVNAVTLPVTNQQLDDVPTIRALIDDRLTLMLRLSREAGLLSGTGVSPQLQGFLTKTGIQTQAAAGDPVPDAIFKAMTKVRWTAFAEPSGVIMHPNDWQDIRLMRTADGVYIWGAPSEVGEDRIWGLPTIVTTAMTENTALTGDFAMFSHINTRQGITVEVGLVNDQFLKNQQTIRLEERLNLEIYRAAAFCTITGI